MAKNKLQDLRDHLFETIENLKDPEKPMEIQRAVAISQVANAIINSAKLEVRAMEYYGQQDGHGAEFFGVKTLPEPKKMLKTG